ncbi:MAG: hypothetical protein HY674_23525 [Chloroflexi bacterium]|nr:hypothetical protein [Chloroflexota bacterium]
MGKSHADGFALDLARPLITGAPGPGTATIKHCVVEWDRDRGNSGPLLTYHCTVAGDQVQWHPELKPQPAQRQKARQVARMIGRGTGRYCFTGSIQDMALAARDSRFRLRFPGLNYKEGYLVSEAKATLMLQSIVCYGESSRVWARDSTARSSVAWTGLHGIRRCQGCGRTIGG